MCASISSNAEAEDDVDAGCSRIAVRHGRSAGLEAVRVVRRDVVMDVHHLRFLLPEPAESRGRELSLPARGGNKKADASGAEQILRHSTDGEVDIERLHVDGDSPHRLKAIEQH